MLFFFWTVLKLDLHEDDARNMPQGFARVKLKRMPLGVWVQFDDLKNAPLQDYVQHCMAEDLAEDNAHLPQQCVYIKLESESFQLPVHLANGDY